MSSGPHRVAAAGFGDLSRAEIAALKPCTIEEAGSAKAGSWIGPTEAAPAFLLILESGWVLRCRERDPNCRRPSDIALPGALLGLETATGDAPDLLYRALTDVRFRRLDPHRWRELLADPDLAERLCRFETAAAVEAEERLLAAGRSATASVCHFLLRLFDQLSGTRFVRDAGFDLPVRLSVLADTLGFTLVHLSRILQALERDGLMQVDRQRVQIQDEAALRALAAFRPASSKLKPLVTAARPGPISQAPPRRR